MGLGSLSIDFVRDRPSAFPHIQSVGAKAVFVDGDASFANFRILSDLIRKLPGLKINVYEEGVGTYRNDLYKGLKRKIFELLGVGAYMGGFRGTNCVYVMHPEEYRNTFPYHKTEVVKIDRGPFDVLLSDLQYWMRVFSFESISNPLKPTCCLYLSTWSLDHPNAYDIIDVKGRDAYVKLHPRLSGSPAIPGFRSIGRYSPAELVIANLSRLYDHVLIYHHGSSVERYFQAHNVEFFRI